LPDKIAGQRLRQVERLNLRKALGVRRRDFSLGLKRPQRVSVTGAGDDLSDGEGVVVMFFFIRYQIVVASSREINFARQFCSVSLVHRMETNIARQFFEVSRFI
jgi:hypothetical protein